MLIVVEEIGCRIWLSIEDGVLLSKMAVVASVVVSEIIIHLMTTRVRETIVEVVIQTVWKRVSEHFERFEVKEIIFTRSRRQITFHEIHGDIFIGTWDVLTKGISARLAI